MRTVSIQEDLQEELARHKWIESKRAGYDLGERAIQEWFAKHWHGYYRNRWVQHLRGDCCWQEFDQHDFDVVHKEEVGPKELVEFVLQALERGWENLEFYCWVHKNKVSPDQITNILNRLDINSHRPDLPTCFVK